METRRKKQTQKQRQKNLSTMTSGGFEIVVTNKSLNDSKCAFGQNPTHYKNIKFVYVKMKTKHAISKQNSVLFHI